MTNERTGKLLILGAALLWSTGGIGIKAVSAAPLAIAFLRSVVAFVALFAIFRPRVRRFTPAFFVALVCYAGCLTSFVIATKWTTAANAIFIQYSGIIWILLFSPLILREALHARDIGAIGVAFAGMALFFGGEIDPRGMAGNLVALLSSLFFAGIFLALRLERDNASEAAVTYGNLVAAAVLLPFAASELRVDVKSAIVLVLLGVFQIAIAYALFVRGLKSVPAAQASLIGMVEPVANPVWVFLLLGERPSPHAIAGSVIVLGAVAWRTTSSAR